MWSKLAQKHITNESFITFIYCIYSYTTHLLQMSLLILNEAGAYSISFVIT